MGLRVVVVLVEVGVAIVVEVVLSGFLVVVLPIGVVFLLFELEPHTGRSGLDVTSTKDGGTSSTGLTTLEPEL